MREFDIGETVAGRYVILDAPLAGGQAFVYQAYDEREERVVGLKCLQQADKEGMQRFQREVRIHIRLDHPNIISMLGWELADVGKDQSMLILVLEWIEGGRTLESLINRELIPMAEIYRLAYQMAKAIAYAHDLGIIHRDIKPGNVLLAMGEDGTPVVKIADFGTAKLVDALENMSSASKIRLTKEQTTLGTPAYMSPEQGLGKFRRENDVWSFWAMIYELTAGRLPFEAPTYFDWFKIWGRIRDGNLTLKPIRDIRPDVPEKLEVLIREGLDPDPDKRLGMKETAALLKQMWQDEDLTTSETKFKINFSFLPPAHDPGAVTMDAKQMAAQRSAQYQQTRLGLAPSAASPLVRSSAEPRFPRSSSSPEIKVSPSVIQVAVPKPIKRVVRAEAQLARISLDIVGPTTQGVAKPGKGKKRAKPAKSQASVIIPPSDEGRVSATSIPFSLPVNPVIAYAEPRPAAKPPVAQPRAVPQPPAKKPGGSVVFAFVVLIACLVTLGILTRERWMPLWQRYFAAPQEVPTQTEQPAPVVATVPAVQTVAPATARAPAPVQTLRPTQGDPDTDSTLSPGSPGRPPPKGGTSRPAKTVDGPPVIEGLPPGAPPPLNQ